MKPDKLQLTELPRFIFSCQLAKLKTFYLFFSLFYFFPFTQGKIHWLCLVLLFFSSLLPLFKTCQVSNVILLVWVRVHGVCSKDGLMNQGLQCSWLTLAGRSMETGSLHCLQSLPGYLQIHIRIISWVFTQSERHL